MTRVQQRTIEKVRFEGLVGEVTSEQLLSVKMDIWQHWRSMLTLGWQDESKGIKARCALCDGRVYIYLVSSGRGTAPAFSHFAGEGTDCKWHVGGTLSEEDRRRIQYGGQQESDLHKELCKAIYDFVSADARCDESLLNQYLPKNVDGKSRRPDVYVKLKGHKPVAIELQLSNTFQKEIVERTAFYNHECIGLIWIFHGVKPDKEKLSASLNDVIHKQRNNAFVLDFDARIESIEQQALVLKCYLKTDIGFDAGQLINVDQLTIPKNGCMYFEDRLAATLLRSMSIFRESWEAVLGGLESHEYTDSVKAQLRLLAKELPGLSFRSNSEVLIKFIASVLTIVADAKGEPKKFASRQKNVTGMVNTYLNPNVATSLVPYAILLEKLIQSLANRKLLSGTLGQHIQRAKNAYGQLPNEFIGFQMESPEGQLLSKLVPEVFQKNERSMLIDFDLLPEWAK